MTSLRIALAASWFALGIAWQEATPPAATPRSPSLSAPVAAALKWLPDDTETVIVANGPFRLKPEEPEGAGDHDAFYKKRSVSFVAMVRAMVLALALQIDGGERGPQAKAIYSVDFAFALEGSRRFRKPRSFGMMSYEGALVADAGEKGKESVQAIVDAASRSASERIELSGTTVAVRNSPEKSDLPALYIASPRPGLLCVASDRGFLEALLARMAKAGATEAFPSELPEWKHVDPDAGVFALRHFRHDDVEMDPTSPFKKETDAGVTDPKAIGLTFECREAESQTAISRYLTGADEPIPLIRSAWTMSGEGLDPKFEATPTGVVEISHPVEKPLSASRYLFVLLGHLGHGIYL